MAGTGKKPNQARKKKEQAEVPQRSVRQGGPGSSTLRRITPTLPSSSIALADASQLLSPVARRERDEALDALARRRRDAEARAGSVQLS